MSSDITMGAGNTKDKNVKTTKQEDNYIEKVVCQESDLKENEMKSFDLGDAGKVLLVRQNGQVYALGNKCTHYGAPLHTGSLGQGHVRCPWHGACFSLSTGDIEDFPGLDSLPCFKVDVQSDGGIKVKASREQLAKGRRSKCMSSRDEKDNTTFLVVGGGPAGQVCVETLRQDGFQGRIIMIGKEKFLPYDRIKLSKLLDATAEKLALRSGEFYKEHNIELKLGEELAKLDTAEKMAYLKSGEKLSYDSIFLATGSSPRALSMPGSKLKNVFVLRNIDEANSIAKQVDGTKHVVVLGASFIGMECAAYCVQKAKSVSVIGRGSVPFGAVLGQQIGARVKAWFEEKGISFYMGLDIEEILSSEADPSAVAQVRLSDGQVLEANVVIAGIGAIPNTSYLQESSVTFEKNGTIPVNEFLATNVEGVFAGGDIAKAPVLGRVASIGHWQLAHYHGRVAGKNMLGKKEPLKTVPFFWTMLFNKSIRYSGYAPDYDEIVLHGSLEDLSFAAYYCKGDTVLAIATCGKDPMAAQFADLLASGATLTKQEVQDDSTAWTKKF